MPFTFVLGGARSGKSAYAQAQTQSSAARLGTAPVMIATAQALDDEMASRIARHRTERGEAWRTVEAPLDLAGAIRALGAGEAASVDCLTLWLSNLMHAGSDIDAATSDLLAALAHSTAQVVVVSNEVGLSIVPENALARRFRDAAGRLNQAVAGQAGRCVVIFAGLPLTLRDVTTEEGQTP
jgi:adenosylcobinamide kinase/adenosylcobinamide-phosphate guanylyltransferase